MKIKQEELNKYIRLLQNIIYKPINEKSTLFFEIDSSKIIDDGSFVMEVKDKQEGAASLIKPGLMLSFGEKKTLISLAYAQIEYCPKFNLDAYFDLVGCKFSKKERAIISQLDAKLVKSEYILAEFEI